MTTDHDLRAEYEREAIRATLSTENGRATLNWLLNSTGFRTSSFSSTDSMTNYQEGKRSIGLGLFNSIMAIDSQAYVRMVSEATDREEMFRSRADVELED